MGYQRRQGIISREVVNISNGRETAAEPKTAFAQAGEIVSSLYKHFLIFDLTYIVSGMTALLIIGFAMMLKNSGDWPIYALTCRYLDTVVGLMGKNTFAAIAFVAGSYFAGLICYDLADNIFYQLYKLAANDVLEWQDYEVRIRRQIAEPYEATILITKFERTHHFEIVSMSFLAVSVLAALAMAVIGKGLLFCFALLALAICVCNCIGVAVYKGDFTEMVRCNCDAELLRHSQVYRKIKRQLKCLALWAGGGILFAATGFWLYFNNWIRIVSDCAK